MRFATKTNRYILKLTIVDSTDSKFCTAFDDVATAMYVVRAYQLHQLGHGKKNGGLSDHKQNRFDLLDRVRSVAVAELSPSQACQWVTFRAAWDERMAAVHQENWGSLFREMVMAQLNDLVDKQTDALSVFMEDEKRRTLHGMPM